MAHMGDVASFLSLGVGFLGFRRDIPNTREPNGLGFRV